MVPRDNYNNIRDAMRSPHLSIVIPVLNERDSLPQLYDELTEVSVKSRVSVRDRFSWMTAAPTALWNSVASWWPRMARSSWWSCVAALARATALQAGFKHAQGEIIFTMDADLQDDPKEIPRFLKALDEGYDLVSGWKENRRDPLGKTIPSKFFNYVTSKGQRAQVAGLQLRL